MVDSAYIVNLMMMNTLGLSILEQTFKMAENFVYMKTNSSNRNSNNYHENKDCYAFIQGTSLELFLGRYHLNYDADELRDGFNYYIRRKSH